MLKTIKNYANNRFKMLSRITGCSLHHRSYANMFNKAVAVTEIAVNHFSTKVVSSAPTFSRRGTDQVEYIKAAVENSNIDWPTIRTNVLATQGQLNQKNFDGVLFKILLSAKHYDAALSFANYLKTSSEVLSLGAINGLLGLYYEIGKTRSLSKEEKMFILDTYKSLYEKYKVLDFSTCEKLLRALCVIDEYEKALKVLEDIYLSGVPSHIAYSILIGTLFRNNKKKKALEIVSKSIQDKRPLQYLAFNEWIDYIFRKYKEKNTILKHLDEIYLHISRNYAVIDENTAVKLKTSFQSLGWGASYTKIRKMNGQCMQCGDTLACLQLTDKEFLLLQQNVKEKLIVGSDLFLKTSPGELTRFLSFVEKTAPYDVVIDALNVAYAGGRGFAANKLSMLFAAVDYFKERNKKILLLGRKHMLNWGQGPISRLTSNTASFFTDNISEDDPFFITAAILSGPHTDIVSKDLLRGHKFLLQDEQLRYIFRRWQWQHQWMVFVNRNKGLNIQPPLSFTPCAQKKNGAWHIPYDREEARESMGLVNDGTPDLSSWLCIRPKIDLKDIIRIDK